MSSESFPPNPWYADLRPRRVRMQPTPTPSPDKVSFAGEFIKIDLKHDDKLVTLYRQWLRAAPEQRLELDQQIQNVMLTIEEKLRAAHFNDPDFNVSDELKRLNHLNIAHAIVNLNDSCKPVWSRLRSEIRNHAILVRDGDTAKAEQKTKNIFQCKDFFRQLLIKSSISEDNIPPVLEALQDIAEQKALGGVCRFCR